MLKKRKWPLKGWHKVTPNGIEAESIIELLLVTRWEAEVAGAFEFETFSRKQTNPSKQSSVRREGEARRIKGGTGEEEKRKQILCHGEGFLPFLHRIPFR